MKTRRMRSILTHTAATLLASATVTAALPAAAQQLRFSTTTPGGIASTGNTLGLSKEFGLNGPGTEDSIGTFISLDPTNMDDSPLNASNPWPAGTTFDWTQNGSEGVLVMPAGSEVLYAELVWGGSYNYAPEDVTVDIDTPVTLQFGGDVVSVMPSMDTALTISEQSFTGFMANYYVRSADVTSFVENHGDGTYAVSGVPATQTTTINSLNAAGWSLVVAYRGEDQPTRNLSIFVGGSFVDEDSQQDYTISGFCAPPFGVVEGKVVVSAMEGDADLVGDDLLIAPTDNDTFVNLSGPNNPDTNFFCSQINDSNGNLDTQGSFGMANHDALNGVTVSGGRQGWDLTTVGLSSAAGQLFNGQSSAVVRTNTTGDSFVPTLAAIEIDVQSPDFTDGSTTEVSMDPVSIGDQLVVTANLHNSGEAPAMNLLFTLPGLSSGLTLVDYSTDNTPGDVDGNAVVQGQLLSGVPAGTIDVNETRQIRVVFDVTGEPENGSSFIFAPNWEHSFIVCDGDPPIIESYSSELRIVSYVDNSGQGGAGGAGGAGAGGSMSAGGMGGGGVMGDDDGDITEDASCACKVAGESQKSPAGWLLIPALFGLLGLRRRRRA